MNLAQTALSPNSIALAQGFANRAAYPNIIDLGNGAFGHDVVGSFAPAHIIAEELADTSPLLGLHQLALGGLVPLLIVAVVLAAWSAVHWAAPHAFATVRVLGHHTVTSDELRRSGCLC